MSAEDYYAVKAQVEKLTRAFNRNVIQASVMLLASAGIWFMAQDGRALDLNPRLEATALQQAKQQNLSPEKTQDLVADNDKLASDLEKIEWALGLNFAGIFGVLAAAKGGKLMAAKEHLKTFAPRNDGPKNNGPK